MDPQQRQRLRAILLDLPDWEDPRSRKALLDFLRGHEVWHRLMRGGSDLQAADDLLDHCTDPQLARIPVQGRTPLCALFDRLKAHLVDRPTPLAELESLTDALCSGALARPRRRWPHPPYPGLARF